jgi:hypothetical protein
MPAPILRRADGPNPRATEQAHPYDLLIRDRISSPENP